MNTKRRGIPNIDMEYVVKYSKIIIKKIIWIQTTYASNYYKVNVLHFYLLLFQMWCYVSNLILYFIMVMLKNIFLYRYTWLGCHIHELLFHMHVDVKFLSAWISIRLTLLDYRSCINRKLHRRGMLVCFYIIKNKNIMLIIIKYSPYIL